jgi:hypothetical protein
VETFSSSVKEILGGCSLIREAANLLLGAGGGVTQVAPASMAPLETQRDKKRAVKNRVTANNSLICGIGSSMLANFCYVWVCAVWMMMFVIN